MFKSIGWQSGGNLGDPALLRKRRCLGLHYQSLILAQRNISGELYEQLLMLVRLQRVPEGLFGLHMFGDNQTKEMHSDIT